jgi:hypothetical protein
MSVISPRYRVAVGERSWLRRLGVFAMIAALWAAGFGVALALGSRSATRASAPAVSHPPSLTQAPVHLTRLTSIPAAPPLRPAAVIKQTPARVRRAPVRLPATTFVTPTQTHPATPLQTPTTQTYTAPASPQTYPTTTNYTQPSPPPAYTAPPITYVPTTPVYTAVPPSSPPSTTHQTTSPQQNTSTQPPGTGTSSGGG